MFATDISFGQQLQYNASTKQPLKKNLEGRLVNLIHLEGALFLNLEDQGDKRSLMELVMTESLLEEVINNLEYYKDSCLIRVDHNNKHSVTFTTIILTNVVHFNEMEPLKLVINQAIEYDFLKYSIKKKEMDFFKEEFLLDDFCFIWRENSLDSLGALDKITLIGREYMCVFQRNKQHILQAIEIRRHRNRAAIFGYILAFKGNILFQDNLDNAQMSYEANKKYQDSLKDTNELLKLWNLYSELEIVAAKEQIEEIGYIKYSSTFSKLGDNSRLRQVFYLEKKPSTIFLQSGIGYAVSTLSDMNMEELTSTKSFFIGNQAVLDQKRYGDQYVLSIELEDEYATIPASGYLLGSFSGSKVIAKRREKALLRILDGKTPLVHLKNILQNGASEEIIQKHKRGVDNELARRIFGANKISFTERQKEAIDIAINTPDIAIIQGPPGTGKTTVIRAIIARLNIIHKGKMKILVSSAQHDAVDNAIENVEYGGLPVNRIGGRKAEELKFMNQSMLQWIRDISNNCDEVLTREENGQERLIIREILMLQQKLHQKKSDLQEAHQLFVQLYPLLKQISMEESIVEQLERLLMQSGEEQGTDNSVHLNVHNLEIISLLKRQRVTVESYMDDGREQLNLLVRHVRTTIDLELEIPSVWNELRVAMEEEEVKVILPDFKKSIEVCLEQLHKGREYKVDEDLLELDIDKFLNDLNTYFETRFQAYSTSLADILWDFKDQLENPNKISELINEYTKINAATCQQSVLTSYLGLKLNDTDVYDYVIIDEAARANPLDLLIPMSLAKHIILVGDHKQLPHLLEENIVKSMLEEKNNPEIRELLNEPLFSRLFTMLEKTKFTSHKRTVMLVDQYRMHPKIGRFVSDSFYNQALQSTHVNEEQKSHHLERYNHAPIAWINVPQSLGKENSIGGQSKARKSEVEKAMEEVNYILSQNANYSIGIITFYKKQAMDIQKEVNNLSLHDQNRVKVGTVDSFQGKEFDVVILSTVRSNNQKELRKRVGFLDSRNRLNVAFSRGKRLLIVVGDTETVAIKDGQIFIKELYNFYQLCRKEGYCEGIPVYS
ncbi:ATP-binding protein [Niallia sp. MER TA 168]|uniref:DEAD/DEAH box helicase n=1 Tax=Niallia sp. MER TA 168 TaxID=2939568 RepID=UPI00203CAB82|nr:ATP-binding protein [Niallia sp. MER TA 168]MCM3364785.1 AAA domain-containing protein [Niallia sp. MER TA 168]